MICQEEIQIQKMPFYTKATSFGNVQFAQNKPILVRITGVTTVRRFLLSAKAVEFPVAGKSFPLRNAIS